MNPQPVSQQTRTGWAPWEWIPHDFDGFVEEMNGIKSHCESLEHLILFRGHRNRAWLLDSTFVRYCKESILGISQVSKVRADFRNSIALQRLLANLFLYKFGEQTPPDQDLLDLGEKEGIDPWFESMKRIQQSPDHDLGPMRGSFLLDWTQRVEVAVYFANKGRRESDEGAVWICDVSAMPNVVHQERTVGEILDLMETAVKEDCSTGLPLVFCPARQKASQKARNQDAIYIAQMDLRFDLAETWRHFEREKGLNERTFLKVVLPKNTTQECDAWLSEAGITKDFIFPNA